MQINSDFLSYVLVVEPEIPKSLKFSFDGETYVLGSSSFYPMTNMILYSIGQLMQ